MKTLHMRHHWLLAAVVGAVALLTLSEASGQSTGAQAVFEGRPAMAGAQAGTGAMAGPPQGGVGLEGSEGAKLRLHRPPAVDAAPSGVTLAPAIPPDGPTVANADKPTPRDPGMAPQRDRDSAAPAQGRDTSVIPRDRDSGVAKQPRSASDKVRKSLKRTREAERWGVRPVESQ